MEGEQKEHISPLLWVVFLCIIFAGIVSYLRYERNLDFLLVFRVDCDSSMERCTTDDESYYTRYEAKARDIDTYCKTGYYNECVETLLPLGLVRKLACDEELKEWESCSDIVENTDSGNSLSASDAVGEPEMVSDANTPNSTTTARTNVSE